MPAIEIIGGSVTAPGATETILTAFSGNSFTVRAGKEGSKILLCNFWSDVQGSGIFKVRSPLLHDNVQGIRFRTIISQPFRMLSLYSPQKINAQDTLIPSLSGSATAGDMEIGIFLIYYEDLPGAVANLKKWSEIKDKIINIVTLDTTLALLTTGGWSGAEAINADFDLLKANTDYAILGYIVNKECAAIRIYGTDTAGLGIGGPGCEDHPEITANWFVDISNSLDILFIPIINSANKSNTYIDGSTDENGEATTVNLILAQLG